MTTSKLQNQPIDEKTMMEKWKEEDFRLLAESCVDMMCRVGLDRVMHYASPSCERILGWKPEELVGKGPEAFVPAQDLPIIAAAHQRLLANGMDLTPTNFRMRKKNGEYAWMEVNASLAFREGASEPFDIVLIMRDVSSRMPQPAGEGHSAHASSDGPLPRDAATGPNHASAPRSEDPRFRKAFSMMPLPMIIATAGDFCILDANDAFSRTTGHGLDDIKGRRAAEARLMDAPTCQAIVKALIRSDGIKSIKVGVGLREGGFLGCLMSAEVVNVDGQRCVIAIFEDVSRRDRMEAELKEAIECVMQDTSWFSSAVVEKLAQLRTPPNASADQASLSDLTSREHEILGLICQGLTDPEICRFLNLSGNTVRNHLASIYGKLNVHRRAAVVVWARERGIYGYEKPKNGLRGGRR